MDLVAITNALAEQITTYTGLRALGQARDSVTPPCAVIIPGNPAVSYGSTMDETLSMNLMVLLIISDAAPVEMTQRALNTYLGIGAGEGESVPAAILQDPSLGGVAHWCEPVSVTNYGRIEYAGVTYFGARLNVTVGAQ